MGYAKAASNSILGEDVVHGLKGHVGSIRNWLTALQQSIMEGKIPDATQHIRRIEEACDDFRTDANKFLSKIVQPELKFEPHSLNTVAYHIHRRLAPPRVGKDDGRRIIKQIQELLPTVELDPFVFLQAAIALADNAQTHAPLKSPIYIETGYSNDGVFLCIKTESLLPKRVLRAWKERDLGIPMPSRHRSGLGLYFADKVIKLHGGTLDIYNDKCQAGMSLACAKLTLPRTKNNHH